MDFLLIILSGLCLLVGFIGTVVPVLPGVPLSYLGIILLHLTQHHRFSTTFLIVWGIITALVVVLDMLLPLLTTKKFGGTKAGTRACFVGTIVGLFLGPWGIVIVPFVAALIGELIAGQSAQHALKAAFGSFLGLLLGTITKLIVSGMMIYTYLHTLLSH